MSTDNDIRLVMVTAPDVDCARRLARLALEARVVACANLNLHVESHYWWQEKIQSSPEILILFKTTAEHILALESLIVLHHPYETPEFVVLPIDSGNSRYLQWIKSNLAS